MPVRPRCLRCIAVEVRSDQRFAVLHHCLAMALIEPVAIRIAWWTTHYSNTRLTVLIQRLSSSRGECKTLPSWRNLVRPKTGVSRKHGQAHRSAVLEES